MPFDQSLSNTYLKKQFNNNFDSKLNAEKIFFEYIDDVINHVSEN